jgi:hypothetical protein
LSWPLHLSKMCPVARIRCPVPECGRELPRAHARVHVGLAKHVGASVALLIEERLGVLLVNLLRWTRR